MLKRLYPKKYTASAYEVPYEKFRDKGYRGVMFDIDNTLVPHGLPADDKALMLFQKLKDLGLETCLISNNKEPRVLAFAKEVGSRYICQAGKPSVKNYNKAMELMKTDRHNTLFVGDQIFTDIYGANRAGIYSILVNPIHPKEEIQIVIKRRLEAVVLYFYRRKCKKGSIQHD